MRGRSDQALSSSECLSIWITPTAMWRRISRPNRQVSEPMAHRVAQCGAAIRSLSGVKRTCRDHRKSVVHDPKRHFATLNCRTTIRYAMLVGDASAPGRRRASEMAGLEPGQTIPDVAHLLNGWCWKSHAATPIVLVSPATVPCPEPWGRQCDGAPEQAANQLKRDVGRR